MTQDELAIRELLSTWQRATAAEDSAQVLQLMTEDAIFLVAGRPPIRGRAEFAALSAANNRFRIDSQSTINELTVYGDRAHMCCHLVVTMTPLQGGAAIRRSGYTLTLLHKQPDGRWLLARDANMLTVDDKPT